MQETIKKGKNHLVKYEICKGDRVCHAEGYVACFNKKQIICFFRDISERINTQQSAAELEKKLKMALRAGDVSVWSYLPETGSFDLADENTVPWPGMKLQDLTDLLVPEDQERHNKMISDIVEGLREKCIETFRLVTPEGKTRWYEVHAMGMKDKEGKIISLIGTQKDITNQKYKIQELKDNKQQRDLLLQITNMITWEHDVATGITTSSGESVFFEKYTSLQECTDLMAPEHRDLYIHAFHDVINKVSGIMNIKVRVVTMNNKYRWVHLIARPSKVDKFGNVLRLIGTREDITEQMKHEQSLKDYIQRFDLAIQSSGIIQWDYDMQTKAYTRLYSNPETPGAFKREPLVFNTHPEDRGPMNEALENMKAGKGNISNLHLRIMMDDDKEYQWVNVFGVPLKYNEKGQLTVVTGLLIDITHVEKAEESNRMKTAFLANMSHEIPFPQYWIHSEKNRLTQVLSNLLSNAAKFTTQGTISVGYVPTEQGLSFYVTDTGKGIDEENLPQVFERFTKFDHFIPGTGLGLSICQTIVHKLNGDISAESEVGKGSTFRFTIDCDQVPLAD